MAAIQYQTKREERIEDPVIENPTRMAHMMEKKTHALGTEATMKRSSPLLATGELKAAVSTVKTTKGTGYRIN